MRTIPPNISHLLRGPDPSLTVKYRRLHQLQALPFVRFLVLTGVIFQN